jgi:dTDP-4-dehydrorhamnose 3,5-epimerase-like enzyme
MQTKRFQPKKFYLKQSDDRGVFQGIINHGAWQEVNVVYTQAFQTRGGHFHRHTTEAIFMLTGRADVVLTLCGDGEKKITLTLVEGEGIEIPPYTAHDFKYLEDSTHLQLLDLRFDPENQDLFPFSTTPLPIHENLVASQLL